MALAYTKIKRMKIHAQYQRYCGTGSFVQKLKLSHKIFSISEWWVYLSDDVSDVMFYEEAHSHNWIPNAAH